MSVVYKKLEDVCEILDSRRVPITAKDRKAGAYPYYGANGLQDYVADYIFDDELVLLAEDGGNFGSKERPIAYRVSGKCWVNNHAHVLKAKPSIHVDYLCYALMFYDTEGLVNGATRQKLTQAAMRQMVIPYRDMTEQLQIIEKISQIVRSIEKRKEELQLLDQLVKSRFIELFGDYDLTHPQESWVTIKEIGTVVGGATPKTDHDEYWGGSYRWITPAELDGDSGYIYDSVRKLTKAGVESCSLQEMPVGTVILSSRAPIGKVAIAGNTFYCNQGFKNIICKEGITPRYLYTVLLLNVEYLNSLGRGATFKEISKGIVESIRIPVPSMELQQQFAAFVEQTDKSKYYSSLSFRYCQAAANTYRQEWMTCRTSDF